MRLRELATRRGEELVALREPRFITATFNWQLLVSEVVVPPNQAQAQLLVGKCRWLD